MPIIPTVAEATTAPVVPLATRLKPYGLDPTKLQLTNLAVGANQTVVLDSAEATYSKQIVKLVPQSIAELKAWIGVPDSAFAEVPKAVVRSVTVLPVEPTYTPQQAITLRAIAKDYVTGHSASVSAAQVPALNAWVKSVAPWLNIILFSNITVAAGAKLVVNASISLLFANDISIGKGGAIQLKCTQGRIDCASITGA